VLKRETIATEAAKSYGKNFALYLLKTKKKFDIFY